MGQVVLRLLFLPWEAWVNLSAACTALWRMLISRRRLLQWQTSAQYGSGGALPTVRAAWPCIALGLALLILSPYPAGKALGIVWLAAPVFALSLGRECGREAVPSAGERRFLMDECAKIWAYFDEFCTAGRGYLPPDNWQEQPPVGVAERTSPTNIGLGMSARSPRSTWGSRRWTAPRR